MLQLRASLPRVSLVTLVFSMLSLVAVACSGGHRGGESAPAPEGTPGEPAAPAQGAALSIKGSDTMVILAQRWAEAYMAGHAGTVVQVSGGGSGTGLAALVNGTTDIATSSRPINEREVGQLQTERHAAAHETRVALDALAIYVHRDNPITSLSLEQLSAIYRGEITNWSAVGGPDGPIVLYSRENNSGTYAYFKEHVLGGADFATTAQTLPGTAAVINAVSHDAHGIGYGGIGYAEGVRTVPVAATTGGEAIAPTLENATSGRYPIARFLNFYTAGEPTGTAASFIEWVLSADGQRLIEAVGFYPLPAAGAAPAQGIAVGEPNPAAPAPSEATPTEAAPTEATPTEAAPQ